MQNILLLLIEISLTKSVFQKCDSNLVAISSTITKQYDNRNHCSTNLTPIQASLKKEKGFVYRMSLDKRKKIEQKSKIYDLVTTDLQKMFSEGDSTNWFFELNKFTETVDDTIPSYKIDQLPEKNNEPFLKKTKLSKKENKDVM